MAMGRAVRDRVVSCVHAKAVGACERSSLPLCTLWRWVLYPTHQIEGKHYRRPCLANGTIGTSEYEKYSKGKE